MSEKDAVQKRIKHLLEESDFLARGDEMGDVSGDEQWQACSGWLTSAQNLVHLICSEIKTPYLSHVDDIADRASQMRINFRVGEMAALLRNILSDINSGLLSSVADRARAEIFDDFLDHADEYVSQQRKNEAGVIAGVVFEDTLRRICRRLNIDEKGVNLDLLISQLVNKGGLSTVKAKRARAAAHVRTTASHAQWDDFEITDVRATIEFTRELVSSKLDGWD